MWQFTGFIDWITLKNDRAFNQSYNQLHVTSTNTKTTRDRAYAHFPALNTSAHSPVLESDM